MEPVIRDATPQDIDAMIGLLESLFSLERDFFFDPSLCRNGLVMILNSMDTARIKIAEIHSRVCGMVSGQLCISTACGGVSVRIEDLVVDRHHRGKGIGKSLLGAISRWAEEKGAVRLQLLADQTNHNALNFYAHLGWKPTSLTALHARTSRVLVPNGENAL